jgi:hypothetical protein
MDAHTLTPTARLAKKAKTPFPGESDAYHTPAKAMLTTKRVRRCSLKRSNSAAT